MPDRHPLDHCDDRELDKLLDSALASYVDQEPDASLRTRVLACAAEARPQPWNGWLLGLGTACACAGLLVFLLVHHWSAIDSTPPMVRHSTTASVPPRTAKHFSPAVRKVAADTSRHPRVSARHEAPRLAVFPTPAPLTHAEEALLRIATRHPAQARRIFASAEEDRKPLLAPITIKPIAIAALSTVDGEKSETSLVSQ